MDKARAWGMEMGIRSTRNFRRPNSRGKARGARLLGGRVVGVLRARGRLAVEHEAQDADDDREHDRPHDPQDPRQQVLAEEDLLADAREAQEVPPQAAQPWKNRTTKEKLDF